ncbi:MAG: hypothetical protein ACTSRE_11760 [Promethearchaeota archaeon]
MRQRQVNTLIIFLIAISLVALGLTMGNHKTIAANYLNMIVGA